jgi:hypothetical protein
MVRTARLAASTLAALAATTTVALAAPVPVAPPTVSGTPVFDSTLQCAPGTWQGAVAFAYDWVEGGNFVAGSGATYRLEARNINRTYVCRVTATDAAGATATAVSAPFTVKRLPMTFSYKLSSPAAGRLRLTGTVGPANARRLGNRRASVVLYRVLGNKRYRQLTIPSRVVPANGKISVTVKDTPGRHTYRVQVTGPEFSLFEPFQRNRTATVRRKRR